MRLNIGSGCRIEFADGAVKKSYGYTNSSLYSQYVWMSKMKSELPDLFPRVWGWDGLGYFMEDLSEYPKACDVKDRSKVIDMCLEASEKISEVEEVFGKNDFNSFLARLDSHWKLMNEHASRVGKIYVNGRKVRTLDYRKFRSEAEAASRDFDRLTSNCHGDMTLENCFVRDGSVVLIDPNPTPDCWRSWILDVAKLCQSVRFDYERVFYGDAAKVEICDGDVFVVYMNEPLFHKYYYDILKVNQEYIKLIKILEVSNYLRMLKYKLAQSEENFRLALALGSLLMEEM